MRKTKTHNVLRRLLAFVLIVSLLPLGYAGNVMAATTGTRNVSIQVTYGQTDARNVYGMINSMRRNSSDAWYWDANNYTKPMIRVHSRYGSPVSVLNVAPPVAKATAGATHMTQI